jgi:hypothetical protein
VDVGLRASGCKALLASATWSGRRRSGSTRRDRTRISTVTPAGSVIFSGEQDNLTEACSDKKRAKGSETAQLPLGLTVHAERAQQGTRGW